VGGGGARPVTSQKEFLDATRKLSAVSRVKAHKAEILCCAHMFLPGASHQYPNGVCNVCVCVCLCVFAAGKDFLCIMCVCVCRTFIYTLFMCVHIYIQIHMICEYIQIMVTATSQ
jgi:hypothetical protein